MRNYQTNIESYSELFNLNCKISHIYFHTIYWKWYREKLLKWRWYNLYKVLLNFLRIFIRCQMFATFVELLHGRIGINSSICWTFAKYRGFPRMDFPTRFLQMFRNCQTHSKRIPAIWRCRAISPGPGRRSWWSDAALFGHDWIILNIFPPNFEGLVLGCIETKFCK